MSVESRPLYGVPGKEAADLAESLYMAWRDGTDPPWDMLTFLVREKWIRLVRNAPDLVVKIKDPEAPCMHRHLRVECDNCGEDFH